MVTNFIRSLLGKFKGYFCWSETVHHEACPDEENLKVWMPCQMNLTVSCKDRFTRFLI